MLLNALFQNKQIQGLTYAKMLDNSTPVFSQFGRNIYASDVVQNCIDCVASECSKLQPRHIRRDDNGLITVLKADSLNRLFKFRPNPLMTTKDFIEKAIWKLFFDYNSFIYPVYELQQDARGNWSKNYTAFYPLNPVQVDFLEDQAGKLYVKFYFATGYKSPPIPYSDIIHLRKKFSVNDVMGGGANGQPDNEALLKTLEINDTVLQGVGKAVQSSLNIRGLLKLNTTLDDDLQTNERKSFEEKMINNQSGILPVGTSADYIPISIDPKTVDSTTLEFLKNKVLDWYGVSLPIFNGTYTDDEYQAFYNKTLEPIILGMGQAFSSVVFTPTEQAYGNEIVFYQHNLELMSVKNKLAIVDGLGNRGALTNNFLLGLFGIEPYEKGNVRIASLNYINADLADAYQMARAKAQLEKDKNKEDDT